jgi:type IV pilus assembly protein PilO
MMKLADLKNLNPKKPGAWPWPAKIIAFAVIFIAVVVAGAMLIWQGQWDELNKSRAEEAQLKESFLAKKRQAINLDLINLQKPRNPLGRCSSSCRTNPKWMHC